MYEKKKYPPSRHLFEKTQKVDDGWDGAAYEVAFIDLYQDETVACFFMAKNINLQGKWIDEFVVNRFKMI